jgi:hypothetical protein
MKIGEWVVIPIIIGVLAIVAIIVIPNEESRRGVIDNDLQSQEEITPEIQEKLDEIEEKRLENEYSAKDREWLTSGPFQIDRSEYVLGEKIFLRVGLLGLEEKGEVVFLKPLNTTHYEVYLTIPFDGSDTATFNYYLQPSLSKIRGYCSVDEFVGDWRVVFKGTDYLNLEFKITEDILPGDEEHYESVC